MKAVIPNDGDPNLALAVIPNDGDPNLASAVDIWSWGCTIIELFNGKPPWSQFKGASIKLVVLTVPFLSIYRCGLFNNVFVSATSYVQGSAQHPRYTRKIICRRKRIPQFVL
ncbi:hypothetical protein ACLB2K_051893 [Fragaria x ananassa]